MVGCQLVAVSVRGCSHITSAAGGGGSLANANHCLREVRGVSQMLTITDEGGGGVSQLLTKADKGGRGDKPNNDHSWWRGEGLSRNP